MIRFYNLLPAYLRLKDAEASGQGGLDPILAKVTDALLQDEAEEYLDLISGMRELLSAMQAPEPYRTLLYHFLGLQRGDGWQESLEKFFLSQAIPWHKISGTVHGWRKAIIYRTGDAYEFRELFKTEVHEVDDYSPHRNATFAFRAARVAISPAGLWPYDWSTDTIIELPPYIPAPPEEPEPEPEPEPTEIDYDLYEEDPYSERQLVYDLMKVDAGTRRAVDGHYGSAVAIQDDWAFVGSENGNFVDVYLRRGGRSFTPVQNEVQTISRVYGSGDFHVTVPGRGTTDTVTTSTSSAELQSLLEDLVGVDNVRVTGGPLTTQDFRVEFIGDLAGVNIGVMTTDANPTTAQDETVFIPRMIQAGNPTVSSLILRYKLEDSGLDPIVQTDIRTNPANYRIRFEISENAALLGPVSTFLHPVTTSETPDASASDLFGMLTGLWDYSYEDTDLIEPAGIFSEGDVLVSGTLATEVTVVFTEDGICRGYDLNEEENILRLGVFNADLTNRIASLAFVVQRGSFSDDHNIAIIQGTTHQRLELVPETVPTSGGGVRLKVGNAVTDVIPFEPSPNPAGLDDGSWLGWRMAYALCEAMQKSVPPLPPELVILATTLDSARITRPITAASLETYFGSSTIDPAISNLLISWLGPHADNYGKSGFIHSFDAIFNSANSGLSLSPEIWCFGQASPGLLHEVFADLEELADHLNLLIQRASIMGTENTEMGPYNAAAVTYSAIGNGGSLGVFDGPQIFFRFDGNGYLGTSVPLIEVLNGDSLLGITVSTVQNGYSNTNFNQGAVWEKVQTLTPGFNEIQRVQVITPGNGSDAFVLEVPGYGSTGAITETFNRNQLRTALEEVVGEGNVRTTGGALPDPIDVEFIGELAGTDIDLMTTDANPEPPADPAFTPSIVQNAETDYTNLRVRYDLDDTGLSPSTAADIVANPSNYLMRFEIFLYDTETQPTLTSDFISPGASESAIRDLLVDYDFEWQDLSNGYFDAGFAPVRLFSENLIEVTGSLASSIRIRFIELFVARRFDTTTAGLQLAVYNAAGTSLITRMGLVIEQPTGVQQNPQATDIEWYSLHKLKFVNSTIPTSGAMRLKTGSVITESIPFAMDEPGQAPASGTVQDFKHRVFGQRIGLALARALQPDELPPVPATVHFKFYRIAGGTDAYNIPYPITSAGLDALFNLSDLATWYDCEITFVSPMMGFWPTRSGSYQLQERIDSFFVFNTGIVEETYLARGGNYSVTDPLSNHIADLDELAGYLELAVEYSRLTYASRVIAGYYKDGYPNTPGIDHDKQYRVFFQQGLLGQRFEELEILEGDSGALVVDVSLVQDGTNDAAIRFGRSLAVWLESGVAYPNGYLAVGAPGDRVGTPALDNAGSVYIFRLADERWVYYTKLIDPLLATDDVGYEFGLFVDLDGTVLVAGCLRDTDVGPNSGAAYVYRDWVYEQRLIPGVLSAGALFGAGVSISGDEVAVSARRDSNGNGAVFIFERNESGLWVQTQKLIAPEGETVGDGQFGRAIALRGDYLFASTKRVTDGLRDSTVHLYRRTDYAHERRLTAPELDEQGQYGRFLSADRTGTRLLVAEPNRSIGPDSFAGMAHLFVLDGGDPPTGFDRWRYVQQIRPFGPNARNSLDYFGLAVAVSTDNALIGAPDHDFDKDGVAPLADAGAAWFYQIFGTPPEMADQVDAVVCDGFAVLPIGLLDTVYAANDETAILIPAGTSYAPQVVVAPPDSFTPQYDRLILRFRALSVNGTVHASTNFLPDDIRTKFIDNVGHVREFEITWNGPWNTIDFNGMFVSFHASPDADVYITSAELVVRQIATPDTSCLNACECLCQSSLETGGCQTTCQSACQGACETSPEGAFEPPPSQNTDSDLQYELTGSIEINRCLGNALTFTAAMRVLDEFLSDQRPIHVLPTYCVTIYDFPEVANRLGDEMTARVIGAFEDEIEAIGDTLVIRPDCTQGCQVSCETFCEVGCEDNCQGIGACESSCQLRCESVCQTDCELVCQSGCVISCQEDSCQSYCQSACEETCQAGCEDLCQGACEIAGCQLSCTSGCEDNCEFTCQQACEFECESPAEIGCATACQAFCETCCEEECEAGSCQTDCQVNGCQTACQIVCQVSCTFTCEVSCEGGCEDSCEMVCQSACEGACQSICENNCQQGCEGGGCEVACEGGCQSGCQSSCEATCEGASCQAVCESDGCQSCCECQCQSQSCETDCTTGCTTGCQTACESACQAAGGCETGCEQACEGSSESCESCCEVCCEEYTEYGCSFGSCESGSCQAGSCEGDSCQVACQGDSTETDPCQSVCQTPCVTACQSSCTSLVEGCSTASETCGFIESIA